MGGGDPNLNLVRNFFLLEIRPGKKVLLRCPKIHGGVKAIWIIFKLKLLLLPR